MKCPCKQCISYAMCISKTLVQCDDFHKYTSRIGMTYNPGNGYQYDMKAYWKHVNSILPKLTTISSERYIK